MKRNINILNGLSSTILGLVMLVNCQVSVAQQDPVFNQYMNNLLIIQPAYAGMSGYLNVSALSRLQWVGFDGAPVTNTLTINGPFRKYNVGVGLSLMDDRTGPLKQVGLYADYSYRILLDNDQYFSFGIKGGFNNFQAAVSSLTVHDPNDPVVGIDVYKKYLPNFGLGFLWHADNFFMGLSVPKVFSNKVNSNSGGTLYSVERNFYAMAGFVFGKADIKFKPTVLARWSENTPTVVDLSANLLFYDRVWAGATYRFKNSFGLLFQAFVNKSLKIGYAYDLTSFQPSQSNAGTHEFLVSYDFPYKKRRYCRFTPRYF